ncbi:MAG: hypothetical protein AAGF45_02670 [Pseudomonadota bacterium]
MSDTNRTPTPEEVEAAMERARTLRSRAMLNLFSAFRKDQKGPAQGVSRPA